MTGASTTAGGADSGTTTTDHAADTQGTGTGAGAGTCEEAGTCDAGAQDGSPSAGAGADAGTASAGVRTGAPVDVVRDAHLRVRTGCDIDVVKFADLSLEQFRAKYDGKRPVVVDGVGDGWYACSVQGSPPHSHVKTPRLLLLLFATAPDAVAVAAVAASPAGRGALTLCGLLWCGCRPATTNWAHAALKAKYGGMPFNTGTSYEHGTAHGGHVHAHPPRPHTACTHPRTHPRTF